MPDTIVLSIEPVRIEIPLSHQWNTAITVFGGNYEQRQPLVDKKLSGPSALTFNQGIEDGDLAALKAFFDARKGMSESFVVPSWVQDGTLFSSLVDTQNTITLAGTPVARRFSPVILNEGNFMVIGKKIDSTWTMNTTHVTSIQLSTNATISVSPAVTTSFAEGDLVFVGYHVRFGSDVLGEKVTAAVAHEFINVPLVPVFA